MLFAAAVVAAVSALPLALAQGLSISAPSLAQCATSTINFTGSNPPYYVAVVPAENPCESDAIAEFPNLEGTSVDYTVELPEGTQVQVYIYDNSGAEYWSEVYTVGGGDGACIGETAAPSSTPVPSSAAPSSAQPIATTSRSRSTNNGVGNVAAAPESESSTSGGFKATASLTLIGGAFAAAAALF